MSIDTFRIVCPDENMVSSLKDLWKEAFGDGDEFVDSFFNTAYSPSRCRAVAEGNNALGALYIFDCTVENKKMAYIYAVATRKSASGKGICTALMRDTHEYLKKNGYFGAILVPSQPSLFDFYKKVGYETCSYISEFEATASGISHALERLDKLEYAYRRQELLPTSGTAQENENLDFLATYADFYAGDRILLAAYKTGDKLFCAELLGDASKAPDVLESLGCQKGFFRTPPKADIPARPFAMYCPIDKNSPKPQYFGLAFD